MSGARKKTTEPKSSKKKTENGSDADHDKRVLISGQGVLPTYHLSSTRSDVALLLDETTKKLRDAEAKATKLRAQLAHEKDKAKKDGAKHELELMDKDHKIAELLNKIKVINEEKRSLAQKVDELTNTMKEMESRFAATQANQDKKIQNLQKEMESLQVNILSEVKEHLKSNMMQNTLSRPNAQSINNITNVTVAPRGNGRPDNGAQNRSKDGNVPRTRPEPARRTLPKIKK